MTCTSGHWFTAALIAVAPCATFVAAWFVSYVILLAAAGMPWCSPFYACGAGADAARAQAFLAESLLAALVPAFTVTFYLYKCAKKSKHNNNNNDHLYVSYNVYTY